MADRTEMSLTELIEMQSKLRRLIDSETSAELRLFYHGDLDRTNQAIIKYLTDSIMEMAVVVTN